ncbi:hypothetical protein CDQ92_11315 [Sphingopyxis bauzanensis]|uniref:Uncharacterized protein n=1 Tax=Sphingopyxis bauzanensis TaxID=651663 RepID=A0A246JX67_9SPHN|nr:hypothetical protein [Sphingopyxis bauzanensis]OWQ97583.1 hypothetical protein CDQ92_11315 [Sphingopyxis bauzanensis]GGJ65221.1 hypothetical protein GCM10011393_39450 [Sphingopyxis bauzanensis]
MRSWRGGSLYAGISIPPDTAQKLSEDIEQIRTRLSDLPLEQINSAGVTGLSGVDVWEKHVAPAFADVLI